MNCDIILNKIIKTFSNFIFHSFNFDICMEMAEEIEVNTDNLCENDVKKMTDQIKLLDKIR